MVDGRSFIAADLTRWRTSKSGENAEGMATLDVAGGAVGRKRLPVDPPRPETAPGVLCSFAHHGHKLLWDRPVHKAFFFENLTAETSRVSP